MASDDLLHGAMQENVLTLLCVSDQHCQLIRNAVPSHLFSTFLYRDIVDRVYDYVDRFKKAPGEHLPDLCEDLLTSKEKGENTKVILMAIRDLSDGLNEEYVLSQLQHFTRQQQLKLGIMQGAEAIQAGKLDEAEAIIEKSMRGRLAMFDPGLGLEGALKKLKEGKDDTQRLVVGIPELDKYGFGPGKKELHMLMAPPKRGKTWWLVHLAKYALLQHWRVLYITLEVSEEIIGRRVLQSLFSMTLRETKELYSTVFEVDSLGRLTGFGKQVLERPAITSPETLKSLGKKIAGFRQKKNLVIKSFPTASLTMAGLRAYLDALETMHHFSPDLILVDYADLMRVDPNNYRISLGTVYKELRGLAVERNLAIATASQTNREGSTAKLINDTHTAEAYSKIADVDAAISYNQTRDERDLKTARLYVMAGRNDRDRYSVLLSQNYEIGQFAMQSRMLDYDYWNLIQENRNSNGLVEEEGEGGE